MEYLLFFPAGMGDLAIAALSQELADARQKYRDDSAVIFSSSSPVRTVASLSFATNAFLVLTQTGRGNIESGIRQLAQRARKAAIPQLPRDARQFRVMISVDGKLTSVSAGSRALLEDALTDKTGGRLARRGSGTEYWVVGRRDLTELILGLRLTEKTKPGKAQPVKMKGALSGQLAALLVSASRPRSGDVFLDPFAGSGSLVRARLARPGHAFWYSDTDPGRADPTLRRDLRRNSAGHFLSEDALTLPSISDGSVDVIVTDPPWGEYDQLKTSLSDFYSALAISFDRVLNPVTGRFVILVARRSADELASALSAFPFKIEATYPVLINGHPANVLMGGRPNGLEGI